ncbi:MAG: Gfo/Idh/MocA family oxidoreductase [Anaerolineaceae bacterium]|nr:Gfo/Idh/MocA family oxidoreductase [Anaerolineaceae bacterium]
MANKLKVGMVGLGNIAHTHVPGWLNSPHAELVAGSDVNPAVFPAWREKHGMSRFYEIPAELINNPEIDIIDICSPNMFHSSQAIAALDAGKHVICEKPLAPTPAEIRQMIAARDRSGKLLMTAQHFRFKGVSQAVKAEIDSGVLGDVYHARSWMLRRSGLPIRPTFIYKSQSGGGPCIDIGVHILDLTLWLMGHPRPVAVSGVAKTALAHHSGAFSNGWGRLPVPQDMDVEDFAAAFVRFDTGATLMIEMSWLLHHNVEGEASRIWLYGTEGGCEWPDALFMSNDYHNKQMINRSLMITQDTMEPHALECVEFARAVAEGLPSPVPPEHSLFVQTILDGIYRSQEAGKEIPISVDLAAL